MNGAEQSTSSRFKAFAMVFGIAMPVLYLIGDIASLPLFTYHPGTDRLEWGWGPARKDEGPAMYWYGWSAMSTAGAFLLGGLAALMPTKLTARLPLCLVWLVPVLLTPVLVYSLNYYWKW